VWGPPRLTHELLRNRVKRRKGYLTSAKGWVGIGLTRILEKKCGSRTQTRLSTKIGGIAESVCNQGGVRRIKARGVFSGYSEEKKITDGKKESLRLGADLRPTVIKVRRRIVLLDQ